VAPPFCSLVKWYFVSKSMRAFAICVALIATVLTLSLTAAANEITEYHVTTPGSNLRDITPGPDGNLWFTELGGHKVGRITTAGVITEFSLGITSRPFSIVSGPDNNLWVTDPGQNTIVRITPGGRVTRYAVPTRNSGLSDIAVGPDGNLWFTESVASKIGRISTTGVVVEFSLPAQTEPYGITAGADGNLWFTESRANKIGRITPDGTVTEFSLPTAGSRPREISVGPDGNVWFVELYSNKIGRITPNGNITEFTIPWPNARPDGITLGVDGNLWYSQSGRSSVARISASGIFKEFKLRQAGRVPSGITIGADANVWIVQRGGSTIARMVLPEPTPPTTGFETTGNTQGVTMGPDSAIWFTQNAASNVGRIAPDGSITYFSLPIGGIHSAIISGPDGNLWYTRSADTSSLIGRITPAGVVTQFSVTANQATTRSVISDLTAGPEGNVWFSESTVGGVGGAVGHIGRITTDGAVTKFPLARSPSGITTGPDGNLWFTTWNTVGRVTPTGTLTEFSLPTDFLPKDITAGPDGNLWFTGDNRIGTVTPEGNISVSRGLSGDRLVTGPDGNLWITRRTGDQRQILRMTPSLIRTLFTVPGVTNDGIPAIAVGNNGNILLSTHRGKKIISLNIAAPITLEPVADGHIRQMDATGNFGFAEDLQTKLSSNSDPTQNREAYLLFDLSQVKTVKTAKLRFFGHLHAATPPSSSAATKTAILPLFNMTWKEGTLTWANRPSPMTAVVVGSMVISVKGGEPRWYEVDVTSHFRSAKASGRNLTGIVLRNITTGATADQYTRFNSRQASSNRPQLVITR
jgi:streptogramin lyase